MNSKKAATKYCYNFDLIDWNVWIWKRLDMVASSILKNKQSARNSRSKFRNKIVLFEQILISTHTFNVWMREKEKQKWKRNTYYINKKNRLKWMAKCDINKISNSLLYFSNFCFILFLLDVSLHIHQFSFFMNIVIFLSFCWNWATEEWCLKTVKEVHNIIINNYMIIL